MSKPVIYFQPQIDKKELSGSNYPEDYFNMERDGFGEIISSVELLKKTILEYVSSDCKMKSLYEKRVRDFFAYIDKNNCQRIYESILALLNQ